MGHECSKIVGAGHQNTIIETIPEGSTKIEGKFRITSSDKENSPGPSSLEHKMESISNTTLIARSPNLESSDHTMIPYQNQLSRQSNSVSQKEKSNTCNNNENSEESDIDHSSVPGICPLETLHNNLTLRQIDDFLNRMI